ncbi:MAG: AMP-binding protein [Acidobacteria bacterium]|nr:AMP-binding protein [Acidobacteriota bacterium]
MLSYVKGPDATLLEMTIDEGFRRTVAAHGDGEALVVTQQKIRLTWSELDARVEATARGLTGLGLGAGDRVGIWSTNNAEWIYLQLATARLGVVLVNVNPAYRSYELRYVLGKSGMRALFLREKDARSDYRSILEEARGGLECALRDVIYFEHPTWEAFLAGGRDFARAVIGPEDIANIQYTSGTTGSPKGVLLTNRNLVNNGWLIGERLRMSAADRLCSPVPMYHCFGCVIASMMCFLTGTTLILPAPSFDALATLQAVHEERATSLYGVPTMFIAELQHPEFGRFDLTSLRTGVMAGAPCPIEVMRRVMDDMHCREISIAYGQTESSPVITLSHVDDPVEKRVSTVGDVLPCTEVKIVSTETGQAMAVGEVGELCARGYMVMRGYDANPEATAAAIDAEGWLHTGDLALMHADGSLGIRGRSKDMIIRGGENIYPREIEEFLYTHPAIADVSVFGLPDEKYGEIVCAWVRVKAGASLHEEEVVQFCQGRIAHFKVPRHVRMVDAFPMTVTGKLQKFKMRDAEVEARGLRKAAAVRTA